MSLLLCAAVVVATLNDPSSLPLPNRAINPVASVEGTVRVITFDSPATFPDAPAAGHYDRLFLERGWNKCAEFSAGWYELVFPGKRGGKVNDIMRVAWLSPQKNYFATLLIQSARPGSATRKAGESVTQSNRLSIMPSRDTKGTDFESVVEGCK